MKTTKFLTVLIAIVAIALSLNSCSKGDAGPAGPQGPAGTNGNANVSVGLYTIAPSSWGSDGNGGWYCNLTPSFNPTQGAINILGSTDDATWTGLPGVGYTVGAPDINFVLNSSIIQIFYDAQTGVPSIAQPAVTFYFKVILIPPAIMVKHPNTNWNNATEVAQLPEVKAALHK